MLISANAHIKNADMPREMQERAIGIATVGIRESAMSPRDIAGTIKKEFDRIYGPTWHCIVGKSFGSYITHEAATFLFFYLDSWAIMLFRTV